MGIFIPDAILQNAVNVVACSESKAEAARKLGIPRETLKGRLKMAAARGIQPMEEQFQAIHGNNPSASLNNIVPAPFIVKGYSNYYNKDGELAGQWVKTKLDDQKVSEAIRASIEALAIDVPRAKPKKPPTHSTSHLCNLYTFTDCHVGMYAWDKETGNDWGLNIAENLLQKAFDYLVDASPPSSTCIINNLGDFIHFDGLSAVTPTNHNPLDADSRFSKIVKVAVNILRYIIDRALTRHEKVVVLMAEGNHDMASSVWLRHLFGLLYENEPSVEVIDGEMPYYVYRHGKTMIGFHHGHMKNNSDLPLLFASQFPKDWGDTTKRYCHVGHRHHHDEKEHSGMKVMQHPTLAGRDAYAARGGWVSERQITAITYHEEYGQVATITATPEMLE